VAGKRERSGKMFNQRSLVFRCCAVIVLMAFIVGPVYGQTGAGTGNDYVQGLADGQMAAHASGMWFFAGFCGGLIGVLIAYLVKPSPSTAQLIGKSPEYVRGYVEGYRDKAGSQQASHAWTGFGVLLVIDLALILIITLAASNSVDNGY
jgi:hypothetical protein